MELSDKDKKNNRRTLSEEMRHKKNRLEIGAIILVSIGFLLLTLVQRGVLDLGPGLADSKGIIALVSINISVLMMCALILLILRGLYRVFFERRSYGSLQAKMVVAFICLSMIPTGIIFYYSFRLIISGHDLWFSPQIEEALSDSLILTEATLALDDRLLGFYGSDILDDFDASKMDALIGSTDFNRFLEYSRRRFHLSAVEFYSTQGQILGASENASLPPIYHDWFSRQETSPAPWLNIVETEQGDLTRMVWPVYPRQGEPGRSIGYLAVGRVTLAPIRSQMEDVRHALQGYHDALVVQKPFKVTQLAALTGMTMLALFLSIWIGSHLARSLSRPVTSLVEGTKRVAEGDLDFVLSPLLRSGEFAELVSSFNQMTQNLKSSYAELDRRRRFVETVLKNVSTGVVILNIDGELMHLNKSAHLILSGEKLKSDEDSATSDMIQSAVELPSLPEPLTAFVQEALSTAPRIKKRALEKHIRLPFGGVMMSLLASITPLRNEEGEALGYLLTFDDLTELERAQRMAAWREVAKRIAHEVKNPLTPIQLATQRLRRRFINKLNDEADLALLNECTDVIIRQVDEMKTLVEEFSLFARLPEIKPLRGDFAAFLENSLTFFRQAHKNVDFILDIKNNPPVFSFDHEQMRRVLTNILENSVAAMKGAGKVNLQLDCTENALQLIIGDNGPGIDLQVREHIFEPNVTTKKKGQGLGLAIVRDIISDHGGLIKALPHKDEGGACFIIELPISY